MDGMMELCDAALIKALLHLMLAHNFSLVICLLTIFKTSLHGGNFYHYVCVGSHACLCVCMCVHTNVPVCL